MPIASDAYCHAGNWRATNTRDKGRRLDPSGADADDTRLIRNSSVTDVDVVIARDEIVARKITQRRVVVAGRDVTERKTAGRSVVVPVMLFESTISPLAVLSRPVVF